MTRTLMLLCIGALLVLAACSDESQSDDTTRDSDGEITDGGDLGVFRIQVGDCFGQNANVGAGRIAEVDGVPCEGAHTNEAFHLFDLSGTVYPGTEAIADEILEGCLPAFETYVGATPAEAALAYDGLFPTEEGWDQAGDREIVCYLFGLDGDLTGSARGRGPATEAVASEFGLFALQVGDCFGTSAEAIVLVPCEEPHLNEVFHRFQLPDGPSVPTPEEVEEAAVAECLPQFETYVGTAYETSTLFLGWLSPTEGSWEVSADRGVTCYLFEQDTERTGSAAGLGI